MSIGVEERQESNLVAAAIWMLEGMYRDEGIDKDVQALRLEAERLVAGGWTPPSDRS